MHKITVGAKALRAWRKQHQITCAALGKLVGDVAGEQLRKFEKGDRNTLPFTLAVNIAVYTGLPLRVLMNRQQFKVAKLILATLAKDAA